MPPSGSFGNRDNENAQKLAIYDRLGAQNERLSLDQQKTQFEQAFRESEQQRKISATEDRLKISQERADLMRQQREVQQSVADAKIESLKAEMALQQHKADSTAEVARQTSAMFNGLEDARDARGFVPPSAIAKLRAQFPDAAMHANNASALEHEVRRFDEAAKLQGAADMTKYGTTATVVKGPNGEMLRVQIPNGPPGSPQQTAALKAQHDSLQAGLQDKDGNYLTGPALSAQVNLINPVKQALGFRQLDPATGQPVAGAAPVVPPAPGVPVPTTGGPAVSSDIQTQGANLSAAIPSVITPPPSPASAHNDIPAPIIPDAAIAHLKENPHLAPDFDAKFGAGFSNQFLANGQ